MYTITVKQNVKVQGRLRPENFVSGGPGRAGDYGGQMASCCSLFSIPIVNHTVSSFTANTVKRCVRPFKLMTESPM